MYTTTGFLSGLQSNQLLETSTYTFWNTTNETVMYVCIYYNNADVYVLLLNT